MSFPVFRVEWRVALRRRRLLAFNVGIPLLLVAPLALGGAPAYHASAAYAVLFVLFGTFGSAIPLLREADGGPLRRVVLSGFPEPRFVVERVLAGTALDFLQLLPAMAVVLGAGRAGATVWMAAAPAILLALLTANVLGIWIAAVAASVAEGALLAAVVALFLLHGSGVFRTPTPGGVGERIEAILPFRPLHEVFLAGSGGIGPGGAAEILLGMLPAAAAPILFLMASTGLSGRLLERISATVQ